MPPKSDDLLLTPFYTILLVSNMILLLSALPSLPYHFTEGSDPWWTFMSCFSKQIDFAALQKGWGSLEIIWSNPPAQTGPAGVGGQGPCHPSTFFPCPCPKIVDGLRQRSLGAFISRTSIPKGHVCREGEALKEGWGWVTSHRDEIAWNWRWTQCFCKCKIYRTS